MEVNVKVCGSLIFYDLDVPSSTILFKSIINWPSGEECLWCKNVCSWRGH